MTQTIRIRNIPAKAGVRLSRLVAMREEAKRGMLAEEDTRAFRLCPAHRVSRPSIRTTPTPWRLLCRCRQWAYLSRHWARAQTFRGAEMHRGGGAGAGTLIRRATALGEAHASMIMVTSLPTALQRRYMMVSHSSYRILFAMALSGPLYRSLLEAPSQLYVLGRANSPALLF